MFYPWQLNEWQRLNTDKNEWPHALLLYGQKGIGKTHFAKNIAQTLLCEMPTEHKTMHSTYQNACGHCKACLWFVQGNHPDFRLICPEDIAALASIPLHNEVEKLKNAPNTVTDAEAENIKEKGRALSKEIKIEQIRALRDFFTLSAHQGNKRVILIYPAHLMNTIAANALLKTLEEPASDIIFILVTDRLDQLLPTIISRCQRLAFATPSFEIATQWLIEQGMVNPENMLAESGGAPMTALQLKSENDDLKALVIKQLAAGMECNAFLTAESLQKVPVKNVLNWLQRWSYDLIAQQFAQKVRYYPAHLQAITACANRINPKKLFHFNQILVEQRAMENHPLNARLVFETLFLQYKNLY